MIRQDVTRMILSFLEKGHSLRVRNNTLMALIPKGDFQSSFQDFGSISLSKVVYKLISKMLVLSLQRILEDLIALYQNAIVKSRHIIDNIHLATKLMHALHSSKSKKQY